MSLWALLGEGAHFLMNREQRKLLRIRNKIICEKKEAINVKGISYPVQTYEVVKFSQENDNLIERNIPGLSLSIDKSEIEDNKIAIKVVSEVLKDLKSKS